MQRWLEWAEEVELFGDAEMSRLQITLLSSKTGSPQADHFERACVVLREQLTELAGVGAVRVHPRTGQAQQQVASWGAPGLSYDVAGERFWVARGGFFQVNRFLLPTMPTLLPMISA